MNREGPAVEAGPFLSRGGSAMSEQSHPSEAALLLRTIVARGACDLHLHTTASTVRKWEQGDTHPAGPALKLLNVIANKGLQAIL